jgi:hypothetical protein
VTLEQLARQGNARWLVDAGIWANIETELVKSYDTMYDAMENVTGIPDAQKLSHKIFDDVSEILTRLKLF